METAISIDMVDQAAGVLVRAASVALMSQADHMACSQATQVIARYIQQVRGSTPVVEKEVPKG